MGKDVERTLHDDFRRQRNLLRGFLRLLQHVLPPVGQQGRGAAAAVFQVRPQNIGGAAVYDGFLRAAQRPRAHLLLNDHGDGILAVAIAVPHIQRVDMVAAARRYLDHLAAQRPDDGAVFSLGVDDDNVIVCPHGDVANGVFHTHGLAAAGHTQHKGMG